MAKTRQKVAATVTRGKDILHAPVPNDPDHDGSVVLALQATKSDVISSTSSSVLPHMSPSKVSVVCPGVLPPIPELGSGSKLLDDVTVEECSEDEALVATLMEEEKLDFSFSNDDYDFPQINSPTSFSC
jgi:hypothetical protein